MIIYGFLQVISVIGQTITAINELYLLTQNSFVDVIFNLTITIKNYSKSAGCLIHESYIDIGIIL